MGMFVIARLPNHCIAMLSTTKTNPLNNDRSLEYGWDHIMSGQAAESIRHHLYSDRNNWGY